MSADNLPSEIEEIRQRLAAHRPEPLVGKVRREAAVALLLRQQQGKPEVLLIQRAEHPGDPWSGDLGFPGGGLEPHDRGPRAAAERETLEEIGLKLSASHYIGPCAELAGAYLPIRIYCFAYLLETTPELQLNEEVVQAFWIPLATLLDPSRNRLTRFSYRGTERQHPVVELQEWSERPLWGITYRLLESFFHLLGCRFTHPEIR